MKSYQEIIAERRKELARGVSTTPASAPKALSVQEAIEKRRKELAESAAKATAAPAPASSAGVLSALERQRRLAEGIPLDPVAPDNPLATAEVSPSDWAGVAEGLGRTASRIPGAFNRRSADVLSAGAKALLFPAASLVDAVSGGTASRDALGNVIIDPLEEIVKSGAPIQGADVYDQLGEAGGQLGLDLMAAVATGGQSTLPAATTRMAPYLAKIAEQTARQSVVPSFTTGSRTAQNVMEAGGSPQEAVLAGLVEAGANTASNILPSNVAGGLVSRVAQGAVSNVAADAAANAAVNPFLPDSLQREVINPEQGLVSALVGGPMAGVLGPRAPTAPTIMADSPASAGAATAREKLQNAGAFADGTAPPPIVPPEGGATTSPATTQKAPVARSAQSKKVSDKASLAAAVRLAADLKADPTLGVPEADRPKTLIERKAAYEAIEQRKAEAAAIEKKLPSIVKGIAKAANVQSDSPFDVTGSTNRIIGNLTKSIPAETPVQSLVRTAQAQTRREVQEPATVEAPAPAATPTPVAETPLAQAGRVIDERRSALEQASRQDRLDEGTVKKLQREEEELRLTLQEDERRKAAGVLQTPEVPYLSEREITSISEKRVELREQLEKHRAAVGYGNQLNDLDTSLSKLGDSDNEVIALATKLQTPTQPQAFAPLQQSAQAASQVPNVQALPLKEASITTKEPTKALEEPIRVTQPEQQSQQGEMTDGMQGQEEGRNAPDQEVTNDASLDVTEPTTGERFASKEDLLAELNSGFADKEAAEARKVADSIVVYDGATDLQSIDPEVAAAVETAAAKQGATGARPRAFQFKGKVYFNMEGVKKGEAKSAFLHEARVHLAAESEPARISSLAGRVEALADLGDATAKEAVATVGKEYPGLTDAANKGNASAKDRAREEVLADFVQRVYERTKAGQGVTGLAKRLYSDAVSYFRDAYTTAAKKYLGEKFALTIKDTDILDAVRYGRTAAGFKGESKPTDSAKARDKSAAFMFTGSRANLTQQDKNNREKAYRMSAAGNSMESIQEATGWFLNKFDGLWRREIDDSGATFKKPFDGLEESVVFSKAKTYRLGDILDHPELFRLYPELADATFVKRKGAFDWGRGLQGSYNSATNEITLTPYAKDPLSTLLHEVQHWVQSVEGFATGGNQNSAVANLPMERKMAIAKESLAGLHKKRDNLLTEIDNLSMIMLSDDAMSSLADFISKEVADTDAWRRVPESIFKLPYSEAMQNPAYSEWRKTTEARDAARKVAEKNLANLGIADTSKAMSDLGMSMVTRQEIKELTTLDKIESHLRGLKAKRNEGVAKVMAEAASIESGDPKALDAILRAHPKAFHFYLSLAGEIEARAVQDRQTLTSKLRQYSDPYKGTMSRDKIADDDVIVAYDGGASESRSAQARDVSQETPLSKGKGIKARLTNLLPTPIKKAALARGTASQETADMVGSMRGMGNLINHTLASDLQALQEVGAKELGKRLFAAEGTQNALVKYFSGDTTVSLPAGIKKVVDKIRAGVDSLSFKLAALGVLTPEKLGALIANLGKYSHRSYKAWDMKPGEWADLVRSSRGVEAKTVAEEMFVKVKDEMLDWIAIPDDATLDALYAKATDKDNAEGARAAITKLNTMLFNHVPAIDRQDKSSAATVKEQIDALKKARDDYAADPNRAVENAERLMQKLLDPRSVDLNDDRTSNFYKLFAVDAGATKTRQEVPNWLQTVWGKNEEFDAVAIATVHAIADMVAKHSKINEYKERLIAAGVVRTPEQGGAFGYSKLDSGNRLMDYGSLEGHYIKDEDRPILEVLGAKGAADAAALFFGGETANAVWAAVEDVAATTKIMGVTLNFSSMMVNAISSIGVISGALVQPVLTAKNIGKSIGLARREALNVVPLVPWLNARMGDQDTEFAADLKQAFEADYLGDVAIAQDLRAELKQQVLDEAYKGAPKAKRATEAVKRVFRDVKDTGSRFSAFGDSVGKMLNWYNRIPQLQKAHPELTPAQAKALALEHAKASMPSYTRSAPLARLISRRAVLVGAFATFNSEMFRTAYNDVQRGVEYLRKGATDNNPAAAWYGTQQLMMAGMKTSFIGGMWKVAGLSVSAMGALVASIGDDDEEEKRTEVQQYKDANDAFRDPEMREALRLVVPDYMRGDVFPIRKVDADNWTVGTLARFDPMGLNNALVAAQKGADAFTTGYAVIEGLIGPSIIGEDIVKGVAAAGTDPDRVKESAGSALRSVLVPGTVRQIARNFSDTMRNMDEGQARDLLTSIFPLPKNETALTGFEKALGWSGLTATPVNIPEEVVRKLSRLGADVNKQQRKATETLNDTVESDQEFWAQAAVIDATAAEAFKKARALVEAADKLGYDSNYIVEAADKYSVPLEDDMLYGAIEGKLYLPDLYKTLDGWYDRKVKLVEKDPAKLAQLNERYMRLQKEVTARNKARIAVAKQEGIDAI